MDEKTFDGTLSERHWRQSAGRQKRSRLVSSGSETKTDDDTLKALHAAVVVSRSDNRFRARQLCATIIFESQYFVASRKTLLRAMLCALLVAHGFRMLSRFVLASYGLSVRISLVPDGTGQPRIQLGPGQVRMVVNQRWLDELSPDDLSLYYLRYALRPDPFRSGDYEA